MLKPRLLENGSYRVQLRRNDVKFNKCFDTLAEAEAALRTVLLKEGTFQFFIDNEYLKAPAFTKLKQNTKSSYRTGLSNLLAYFGPLPLAKITTGVVTQYQTSRNKMITRLGGAPSGDTVRSELIVLSRVFAHAAQCDLVKVNPVREAVKPEAGTRERRVTTVERATMLLAANGDIQVVKTPESRLAPAVKGQQRVRIHPPSQPPCYPPPVLRQACRFLLIQYELACRANELATLEMASINYERREAALVTKTQKIDIRPLSPLALRLIGEQLEGRDERSEKRRAVPNKYLFPGFKDKPYDYQTATTAVREYGIVDATYSTHANRHGYASRSKELGMTKAEIMAMGGWKTGSVVDRYIHTSGLSAVEREPVDGAANLHLADLAQEVSLQSTLLKVETAAKEMLQELANTEAAGESGIAGLDQRYALNKVSPGPVSADPFNRIKAAIAAGEITLNDVLAKFVT
jgi:site-specific recombinase XerD